jgi:hypothetical protein
MVMVPGRHAWLRCKTLRGGPDDNKLPSPQSRWLNINFFGDRADIRESDFN